MAYQVDEAKKLVIEAGLRLQREGLIVRTWGNISARISDKQFVITPSGRSYESLKPDDIVVVDIKKCTYKGNIKPSSECGIHADVYAKRPEVNFVVHTHQAYASAVSVMGEDVELTEDEKKFLGERIPCAKYGMSSSTTLRRKVKKALKLSGGCYSLLLKNHGVLCMGRDYENAFEISSCLEQICKYKYEKLIENFDKIGLKEEKEQEIDGVPAKKEPVDDFAYFETRYFDDPTKSTEDSSEAPAVVENAEGADEIQNESELKPAESDVKIPETETAGESDVKTTETEVTDKPVEESEESEEAYCVSLESVEEADEDDLKAEGYLEYGFSHLKGTEVTLVLGDEEYKYQVDDKRPIEKSMFKRKSNKIALIHSKIYETRNVSCICHVTLPNIIDVSSKEDGFDAYIDDMAQIVGESVKCVGRVGKKPHFESIGAIARGLKNSDAVLIAGQGAICIGNSESDVEAAAYVLEKSCMAAKVAMCNPTAKHVPRRIAKKERIFYKETYSKLK